MIDVVVDIYHGETPIDFEELKANGIVGVIHKASEGTTHTDTAYANRKEICKDLGLLFGAYHFMRPGDMREEAKHFIRCAGKDVDIHVADHEDERVSIDDLKVFLREVTKLTGKEQLVIYSGHVMKEQLGDRYDAELAKHRLWLCHYTTGTPSWPKGTWPQWWLWQYTEDGQVEGFDGDIDRNKYQGTVQQLFADWTGEEAPPEPSEAGVIINIETSGDVPVVIKVNGVIVE